MSKCDICKQEFGQYANLKDCGLIMCDGCCYDPSKQQLVELTSKERKLTEENRKLREALSLVVKVIKGDTEFACDEIDTYKLEQLLEGLK